LKVILNIHSIWADETDAFIECQEKGANAGKKDNATDQVKNCEL
jgi:hypothetical protein